MPETPELAAKLAAELVSALDLNPDWERHGELETSPWGSGQWVVWTDPADGRKHIMRIVVEPYRPE